MLTVTVRRGPGAAQELDAYARIEGVDRQGAPVYVGQTTPVPTPIGWAPTPDVVIWLGTNALTVDELVEIGAGIRLEE